MISDRQFLWLYDKLNVCNTKHQNYDMLTLWCRQHYNTCFVSFPVRACTIISGPFVCCTALLCFCQSCYFSFAEPEHSWREGCALIPFSPLWFPSLFSQGWYSLCMTSGGAVPRRGEKPYPWDQRRRKMFPNPCGVSESTTSWNLSGTQPSHTRQIIAKERLIGHKNNKKIILFPDHTDSFLKSPHVEVQ